VEEFRHRARHAFGFLEREFGLQEVPIPTHESPYRNKYAVWFGSPTTRVVVEGINWGMNARVALGRSGPHAAFENYDLGDLLAIRRSAPAAGVGNQPQGGEIAQLAWYATALREVGADILRGDHSVFPALAERVERRRAELAAGRVRARDA
jgi:hypothetical protein